MRPSLVLLLVLAGCAAAAVDERSPLERAEALLAGGDLGGTRAALEEHLEAEPEDPRARYLLARTLSMQGELRGARAQAKRALALDPQSVLAWDVLAATHEALGEHREALAAYRELQRRTDSTAPALGVARCALYLGDAQAALDALDAVRSRRNLPDLVAEHFAWRALRGLGREAEAEAVARGFLAQAGDRPDLAKRARELRDWLASRTAPLDPAARQAMIDYVRAACRLRLPGRRAPEADVLDRAPQRLYAFDQRPVFVTLLRTPAPAPPFGVGRGDSLAAALKGAVEALRDCAGFAAAQAHETAVRIDLGRELQPVELHGEGPTLTARPPVELARHGIALRADGLEAYCLPGDPLASDLPDLAAMLDFAVRRAGLPPDAWRSAAGAVWRFETDAFVSPAPGAAPLALRDSEPVAAQPATAAAALEAGARGARFLTRLLLPGGGLAAGYDPTRDALDAAGGDEEQIARAADAVAAEVAHALALWSRRLPAGQGRNSLLAACRLLLDPLLSASPPEPGEPLDGLVASAWTLRALAALGDPRQAELARALADAPEPAAAPGLVSLALAEAGRPRGASDAGGDGAPFELLALWAAGSAAPPAPLGAAALSPDEVVLLVTRARVAAERGDAQAGALRSAVLGQLERTLARQLTARHRFLLRAPERAQGGVRATQAAIHLRPGDTAAALRALDACAELLGG